MYMTRAGLAAAILVLLASQVSISAASRLQAQNQNKTRPEENRGLDGMPLNPLIEMERRVQREAQDKRFQELKSSAVELADLSRRVSDEIEKNGKDVISAKVFENLDKIEKLVKQVRNKAKDGY
jgi:hypothetical protein